MFFCSPRSTTSLQRLWFQCLLLALVLCIISWHCSLGTNEVARRFTCQDTESAMAAQQRTDERLRPRPLVALQSSPVPFPSGTLQASVDPQLLAQRVKLSPVQDEQHQTSVCKRLTNSDESPVLSVSQALESTPFLTMDNRFKVLTLDSPPSDTADALSRTPIQRTHQSLL